MNYPSIDKIISICESKLSSLDPAYRKVFDEEIKDLKKWKLFLQTDKADELLQIQGKNLPTNKSGSLILFLLGASTIDPVKNSLKKEIKKFGKADPPDIDIDFHPEIRDQIKSFLVDKFGVEHVCSVGTVGTYKTKNVIQDVARALGLDINEAVEVTKNLEAEIGEGEEETKLDKASFDEICEAQPALKAYFEAHEDVRRHAEVLRNQAKNYGTHAGGVIISNLDLTDRIPVFHDKENRIVSAWAESGDHQELSSVGLVKFDCLGLCLEENTLLKAANGTEIKIKDAGDIDLLFLDEYGNEQVLRKDEYIVTYTGFKYLIEIILEEGSSVRCSRRHRFFSNSIKEADSIKVGDSLLTLNGYKKVVSIESPWSGRCYDISLLKKDGLFMGEPNFILANGIISHNCNLPVIDDCLKLIKENRGITLTKKDIPINDRESIRLGTKGELWGIFQFENPYTKKIGDKVGIDSLGDIAAITSLIRPGPKDVGLDVEYAERKNGKKYDKNPVLEKVLGDTYGILAYQEGLMKLAVEMAGMTPLEGNRLRKGASKKKAEIMDELKPKFINGSIEKCVKTGLMTEEQVNEIWNQIESTAKYSFNRSHAITYSAITTIELWLRYHYFPEFMTALIQNASTTAKKFGDTIFDKYVKFAISGGITVHKPDINKSGVKFRLKGTDMWYGLGHVKNVSSAAEAVEKNQPYTSMEDFYDKCKVTVSNGQERRPNSRVIESLIYAGAFDCFGSREEMMKKYYLLSGKVEKTKLPKIPAELKGYILPEIDDIQDWKVKGKLTFVKKFEQPEGIFEPLVDLKFDDSPKYLDLPALDENTLKEKEEEMLAVSFDENLCVKFRELGNKYRVTPISVIKNQGESVNVRVLGKIKKMDELTAKSGNNYMRVKITDGIMDYTFMVWSSGVNEFKNKFEIGDIAIIPLKNRGPLDEHPNDRFYNDRGDCKIIERNGILQDD